MIIVSCDSNFLCYLYFPLVKYFICDFFSLVNIFLGKFDVELIFINGLDSLETLKFI